MMTWEQLLSEERVRKLMGGAASRRVDGDRRTEFDRDFDRAIFSSPVKRLQDKAQVFPLEPNDSVRTRLTHSLEVSSVARGMAGSVGQWLAERNLLGAAPERAVRAIEAIAATCGLIHDLGNPPFGHSGEQAIQDWFRGKSAKDKDFLEFGGRADSRQLAKDFLCFEGNAQTLRLVSKLQILADEYGLNLTCGTVSAACKYLAPSDYDFEKNQDHGRSKVGFFASETELVLAVRANTGTGQARNPITFLVEAADDAVYSTVDLEDGVRKGILHWRTIERRLKEAAKDDETGLIVASLAGAEKQVADGVQRLLLSGRAEDEARIQAFRVAAIGNIVVSVIEAFATHYSEIMAGQYPKELVKDSRASKLVKVCKSLGREFVYRSDETLRLEVQGRRIIQDLMDICWEGAEKGNPQGWTFPDKICALLSKNYRAVCDIALKKGELPEKYCKLQLVTDYVCGMTDTFACNLHKRLTNG